jgi:hypothetical protein
MKETVLQQIKVPNGQGMSHLYVTGNFDIKGKL